MKIHARYKARQRLDERLQALRPVDRYVIPPKGWVRAIRDALGMTGVQLAKRLGISPQSVDALERSEATGSIKLETLRRAAEALDCTLVYALVPSKSLESTVRDRARAIAVRDLARVTHTMKLEAQQADHVDLEEQIEEYIRDNVKLRDLWSLT
jgi:predicted DNA-binding mobile mystery protein A